MKSSLQLYDRAAVFGRPNIEYFQFERNMSDIISHILDIF